MSDRSNQYEDHPNVIEAENIVRSAQEYYTNRDAARAVGFLGAISVGVGLLFTRSNAELIHASGILFTSFGACVALTSAVGAHINRVAYEQRLIDADRVQ